MAEETRPLSVLSLVKKNKTFLANLYARGPFQRHAFCCNSGRTPLWKKGDYTLSKEPLDIWLAQVVGDYRRDVDLLEKTKHDGVPVAHVHTGTQLYACAFGCEAFCPPDDNPFAKPFVFSAEEADRVEEPDLWNCPGLVRVFELARLVQRELGPEAYLGPSDIQSGFDTACLIWDKTDLYFRMRDPEGRAAIKRLTAKCASLLKKYFQALRGEFPRMSPGHCPGTWVPPHLGPWLSNDECGLMNTADFEELCLPELVDLAETFGGLGMHCCSDAEHQFESFKKIPNLYAFNRVPARLGLDPILKFFGGPDAPVHVLGWTSVETSRRLMEKAPEGTRFIFEATFAKPEEASVWLEQMRS